MTVNKTRRVRRAINTKGDHYGSIMYPRDSAISLMCLRCSGQAYRADRIMGIHFDEPGLVAGVRVTITLCSNCGYVSSTSRPMRRKLNLDIIGYISKTGTVHLFPDCRPRLTPIRPQTIHKSRRYWKWHVQVCKNCIKREKMEQQ